MSTTQKKLTSKSNPLYKQIQNLKNNSPYKKFLSQIKQATDKSPTSKQKIGLNTNTSLLKNSFESSIDTKFEPIILHHSKNKNLYRNKIKNFENNLLVKESTTTNKKSNINEDKILINDNQFNNMYENFSINDELTDKKTNNKTNNTYYNPFIYPLNSVSNQKKFYNKKDCTFDSFIIENTNFYNVNQTYDMKEIQNEIKINCKLSPIQNKKRSNTIKIINQLKKDLNTYKNDSQINNEIDLIEYEDSKLNNNKINQAEKNKILDNNIIDCNSNNQSNNLDSESEINNNDDFLGSSFEIIDFDKTSEYTLETGTNIDYLRKKSKFDKIFSSSLLLFLCSGGLFFLFIKKYFFKKKDKTLINLNNFSKIIENFFDVLSVIGCFESNFDIYKLFGLLIAMCIFLFIFRLFMKKMTKIIKNLFNYQ